MMKDVYIGWQFASIFHSFIRKEQEEIENEAPNEKKNRRMDESDYVVDTNLIHDIVPQYGGGNEPIYLEK